MATTSTVHPLAVGLDEAAAMIGVRPRTLRKWSSQGRVRSIRLGSRLVFRIADLEALLAANERAVGEKPKTAGVKVRSSLQAVGAAMRVPVN
jgi:excisionase family DNA binding protein